jgi:hypothetical protein
MKTWKTADSSGILNRCTSAATDFQDFGWLVLSAAINNPGNHE